MGMLFFVFIFFESYFVFGLIYVFFVTPLAQFMAVFFLSAVCFFAGCYTAALG